MLAANRAEHERRKAPGHDPAHGGKAAKKRGATQRKQIAARRKWEAENESRDPQVFIDEILPALRGVSVRTMAAVTGLSESYCSEIRRGDRVPHPRHWAALATLGH